MLEFLNGTATDRKLRLFACGCCRRIWNTLSLKDIRRAVETAERFADGEAEYAELDRSHCRAITVWTTRLQDNLARMEETRYALQLHRMGIALNTAHDPPFRITPSLDWLSRDRFLRTFGSALIRCVFANPFQPVSLDPRWRTSDVSGLARAIYEARAFDRLPILADALLDAGCEDEQVISHCRNDGPHARGCWVVDLVLGKE
jgi:hypothetical protein